MTGQVELNESDNGELESRKKKREKTRQEIYKGRGGDAVETREKGNTWKGIRERWSNKAVRGCE